MKSKSSMSSEDLRLEDVPSIEDLEKIERYIDEEDSEGEMLRHFVQSELLERMVEKDDRYDETTKSLKGNEFDYGDIRGVLKTHFGSISGRVFTPEDEDISVSDIGRISGASTGNTMHSKAMNTYESALKNAGYELDDPSEEDLIETAERALEEIDNEAFSIDIEDSTREAYGEAVRRIEEYRNS
ncbi:MAG: hypothetical protein ABEK04_05360 [Candidatus Nanohalobium sp.]